MQRYLDKRLSLANQKENKKKIWEIQEDNRIDKLLKQKKLRTKTLIFCKEDLPIEMDSALISKYYLFPFKIVSKNEFKNLLQDFHPQFVLMYKYQIPTGSWVRFLFNTINLENFETFGKVMNVEILKSLTLLAQCKKIN